MRNPKWLDIKVGSVYEYDTNGILLAYGEAYSKRMVVVKEMDKYPLSKCEEIDSKFDKICHIGHLQKDSDLLRRKYKKLRKYYKRHDKKRMFGNINMGFNTYIAVGFNNNRFICLDVDGKLHNIHYTHIPNYRDFDVTICEESDDDMCCCEDWDLY